MNFFNQIWSDVILPFFLNILIPMNKPLLMLLCSALVIQSGVAADTSTSSTQNIPLAKAPHPSALVANPLLVKSTLQYEYPVFDKIHNEDYAPAFASAMRLHDAEIKAIASNPAKPNFDNTIVAMERAGQALKRVATIFFNQVGANTNPTLEALSGDLAPKLSAHQDAIFLNAKLFQRINILVEQKANLHLDAESERLLERYYTDFVRAGAKLSNADKEKLKSLNAQLATMENKFNQNVLKEMNASALVIDTKEELAGLSASEIETASSTAKVKGLAGKYMIPLMNTTGQPLLATLENRATRQRLYEASINRGSHGGDADNRAVTLTLARLRAERAELLGYPNFAAYSLEDETAKSPAAVNKMLSELAPAAVANAKKEGLELQKLIDEEHGGFQLAAWDWAFYTERLHQQKFAFDDNQLRPYFELNNVLQNGVFYAANQLYGITFKERKDLPVYQPTVRVFEVFDADGKSLAIFIADMYARDNKRGGAWMNNYVDQSGLFGSKPVIANHLNIPQPPPGEPTLLTPDEVKTAFHEFGHALHGMFSNVRYPRFSGTNVPRDFVEYPSQVNEMWAVWPEVLKNYAKHYQTGQAIPQDLVDKIVASGKFNQGFTTTEYLAATLLDQRWHQLSTKQIK